MRSLFVKFFLSFLLINVLLIGISIGLTYLRQLEFPPLAHQHFARQALIEYGRTAVRAYEDHEFDQYAESLRRDAGIRILLFDDRGRALFHHPVPRRVEHMVRRTLRTGEMTFPRKGEEAWLASVLKGAEGKTYVVVLGLPDIPPPGMLIKGLARGWFGWRLLLLLLVSGAVCYYLARSFAAPIGRLRQATRQFAAGDLAIRIGDQVTSQNEIGGLAKDFDHMAERIENLVGAQQRLLRDISHELRSPLARLRVALELARQEGTPDSRHKALARIELEAERMNEMIGQLLSLTRLETGGREIPRQEFDLAELLASLIHDADFEARNRGCRVRLSGEGSFPFRGSEELLARALENVIRNAVKYTFDNSSVTVELEKSEQAFFIRILDQGPGVPEEALGKLFQPFYRVADARDRQTGGTGIGLAIAERAILLHGGSISASNHPQGGLLMEIALPVRVFRRDSCLLKADTSG